jgi:hypothetical protein
MAGEGRTYYAAATYDHFHCFNNHCLQRQSWAHPICLAFAASALVTSLKKYYDVGGQQDHT